MRHRRRRLPLPRTTGGPQGSRGVGRPDRGPWVSGGARSQGFFSVREGGGSAGPTPPLGEPPRALGWFPPRALWAPSEAGWRPFLAPFRCEMLKTFDPAIDPGKVPRTASSWLGAPLGGGRPPPILKTSLHAMEGLQAICPYAPALAPSNATALDVAAQLWRRCSPLRCQIPVPFAAVDSTA